MISTARAWTALSALAVVIGITAAWWALALWPIDATTPEWLLRTREVCFGSMASGLPNAGGWLLLIGQPLGMLLILVIGWPAELRAGLQHALARASGQVAVGMVAAALVAGVTGAVVRVAGAGAEPFSAGPTRDAGDALTRVDDAPPAFALVNQRGEKVTTEALRGRPTIVTFAYAHCDTICPLIVADVVEAARQLGDAAPRVLVITLDPWRDTPSRLGAMAEAWKLPANAEVLSGEPGVVDRALNAWRIPRVRTEKTGDLSHPSLVYILNAEGRITYVVDGHPDRIVAAVKGL